MPQKYSKKQEQEVVKLLKVKWKLKTKKQVISKAIHQASAELYW